MHSQQLIYSHGAAQSAHSRRRAGDNCVGAEGYKSKRSRNAASDNTTPCSFPASLKTPRSGSPVLHLTSGLLMSRKLSNVLVLPSEHACGTRLLAQDVSTHSRIAPRCSVPVGQRMAQ